MYSNLILVAIFAIVYCVLLKYLLAYHKEQDPAHIDEEYTIFAWLFIALMVAVIVVFIGMLLGSLVMN